MRSSESVALLKLGSGNKQQTKNAVVLRLGGRSQLIRTATDRQKLSLYETLCALCEQMVCLKLDVSLEALRSRTRCSADVALARQIAMYLAHTSFGVIMSDVGTYFARDRTTVSHACNRVEDKRENFAFDTLICQLEAMLQEQAGATLISGRIFIPFQPPAAGGECDE